MMVLMLQKEVAERIVARPSQMSLLAVSVQFYAKVEIIEYVGKENFWPSPEVDSAIIRLTPHPPLLIRRGEGAERQGRGEKLFFRLVKHGFSSKRKMLKNNLAAGVKLEVEIVKKALKRVGISAKARAQELSLEKWLKLFDSLKGFML